MGAWTWARSGCSLSFPLWAFRIIDPRPEFEHKMCETLKTFHGHQNTHFMHVLNFMQSVIMVDCKLCVAGVPMICLG